jgi:hypothetical protein
MNNSVAEKSSSLEEVKEVISGIISAFSLTREKTESLIISPEKQFF